MTTSWTRREVIGAGLLGGASLVAGCAGQATTPTATPANEVVRDVDFDGGEMVVSLRDDHDVSKLNLIGPDGQAVTRRRLAAGETTATLEILDIRPGVGGYEHYEPGEYELVAVREEGTLSQSIELVPELRIIDVQQYRDGEQNTDLGKLAVTVKNVGTGPTWVYDITTRGAPNRFANDPLYDDPGLPQVFDPASPLDTILDPGEVGDFVGYATPLVFTESDQSACEGVAEFVVIVDSPRVSPVEKSIFASFSGDVESVGLTGDYVCSETDVEIDDGKTSPTEYRGEPVWEY